MVTATIEDYTKTQDSQDIILLKVTFNYHDLDGIGDGEDSVFLCITEEDYSKIEEYYKKPWAHYIGVMINTEMPHIMKELVEMVDYYAEGVFISHIELSEPDDEYDYDGYYDEEDGDDENRDTNKEPEEFPF